MAQLVGLLPEASTHLQVGWSAINQAGRGNRLAKE